MQKILLSIFVLMVMCSSLFAQRNCSAMDVLEQEIQQDPKRSEKLQAIERVTRQFVEDPSRSVNGVITIPVVVHVVYNGSTQNISDAQIQSQITVLNQDFRRTNSDADNTWPVAADSEIEFCLATVAPDGSSTNGITRKSTTVNGFGTNNSVKSASSGGTNAWDASKYMNMWVCNIGGNILGYAQFPGGSPSTDGIVIDYRYFGTTGTSTAPFDKGRTATHEVGHYLNLRHIWGDGGCSVDDYVSDTPKSDASNGGCAVGHVSCNTVDMVQNYMDYSNDACMNLFTQGQKTRMRALFASGGARASLLSSNGCGTSGPTCSDGIQNGDETGVDCGGSCPPCNAACTDVVVNLTFDNYPEETSWEIKNSSGSVVASGGTYGSQADGSSLAITNCLPVGCYTFTIIDTYGDGICCNYGNGSYNVSIGGNAVVSGASFGSSETKNFCVQDDNPPAPSCSDGVQNGDETGVDCGGSCTPCAPACTDTEVRITFDNYPSETSWTVKNASSTTVMSGSNYGSQSGGSTITKTECLPAGCYTFKINDSYGDGICCSYGSGSFKVTSNGSTLVSGGTFGYSYSKNFCVGNTRTEQGSSTKAAVSLDVNLYPIPVTDLLNVDFNATSAGVTHIRILNANGKLLQSETIDLELGKTTHQFELSEMTTGVYYMYVIQDDKQITKKFVVLK